MTPDYEKIVQMINFFARRMRDNKITMLPCLKIIFLADRYHLRMYGRTITGDRYVAMQYGPVASNSKKTFQFLDIPDEVSEYASLYLTPEEENTIVSVRDADLDVFSETDLEAMNAALKVFRETRSPIVAFTHCFPEWSKHENALKRVKVQNMDLADFFLPAEQGREYCPADKERIRLNKLHFEEMAQVP